MNREPDCNLIRRWISLVEDQELSDERTQILESHLDHCSSCRNWKQQFQHGLDALDIGVDKVSDELGELLRESLGPDKLITPSEPEEISRAADRAAPRLAAFAAGVLIMISVLGWGFSSNFTLPTWLFENEDTNTWALRSTGGACTFSVDGIEQSFDLEEIRYAVEFGQKIECRSGSLQVVDQVGRTVSFSEGAVLVPVSDSRIRVTDGTAFFEIPEGLGEFGVITDEVEIVVVGTVFEVSRMESALRTEVRVAEGSVAVVRDKRVPLPLKAGERAEVTSVGLMFHPVRGEREGGSPFPRARLGEGAKERPLLEAKENPTSNGDVEDSANPGREGSVPLDLPVNQRHESNPDGED